MNRPILKLFAAASVLGLALAGCSQKSGTAANASATASDAMAMDMPDATDSAMPAQLAADSHGAMFLTDAMKGDNSEVKLGQLAADQGGSDAVKKFGQMLATDHGKHVADLASLAAGMGVARTDAINAEADSAYAMLKALHGDAFDTAFKKHMIADHQKDIAKYEAEAKSKDPAALTGMATDTLPTLRKHLAVAQGL
jgi:putative membrane protein